MTAHDATPLVVITPVRWFTPLNPSDIWKQRDLILLQVIKGFRARYTQTITSTFASDQEQTS